MTEDEEFEALEQRLNMKEQEYKQINHPNGVTTWKTKPKHKEQAMNREDIIRMARQAGFSVKNFTPPVIAAQHSNGSWVGVGNELEIFANLVAAEKQKEIDVLADRLMQSFGEYQAMKKAAVAAEREACAKVCETFTGSYERGKEMEACAAAMRARSKQ